MNFEFTSEQKMLKEAVREMVEKEIRPNVFEWERQAELEGQVQYIPKKLMKKYIDMGLMGICLPEKYGGQGLGVLEAVIAVVEIAKLYPRAALPVFEANMGPSRVIELFGTEAQRQRYLPKICDEGMLISVGMTEPNAGSALTDLTTSAVLSGDHYILNGEKRFVTGGGHSDAYVVYCRLSESLGARGIGGIIVEKGTEGFTFGSQERFMGFSGVPSSDLIFNDCRVPKDNLVIPEGGFKNLMRAFCIERLGNTSMSLGIATGALEESIRYAKERKQYGKFIAEFQAIQLMLADMAMKVDAARMLLYRAAVNAAQEFPSIYESSVAKCYANEIAKEVSDLALQIHGGYGYSKAYPIERMVRDSRGWPVAGGTVQIQRINIASELLGQRFDQRK